MDTGETSKPNRPSAERIRHSTAYRSALARAAKVLKKPEKLTKLVDEATAKAGKLEKGPIVEARDNLTALFRMVRAYGKSDYRSISWTNIVLVVGAIVYFVMPIDLVPDFIAALGYLDDAAILTWTVKAIGDELEKFKTWEKTQPGENLQPVVMAED